ncbi:MAG: 50S ribosomal protein L30 [Candidatus Thermoplasmatota archaeon]|nr:50S ribosomal protein L30 [Candidatus Thermoplasmatota archaeon]
MTLAVIRVRGTLRVKPDIKETMRLLRLNKVNHCILIPETPEYLGMLQKAKDYITWGEVDASSIERLLAERSEVRGVESFDAKFVKKATSFKDMKELSAAVSEGRFDHRSIEGLKPVFRLAPPRKGGYEGIKRHFTVGGALGYRGKEINNLLERMI